MRCEEPQERAIAFVELLKKKQTRKGDFAQRLSAQIEAGEVFQVPLYLREAIQKVAEQ